MLLVDPLTRPDRARHLIERLAGDKALVLDTSGVGDVDLLIPVLKEHKVHVRVSIDTISNVNRKLRPANREYVQGHNASFDGATRTIERCLEENIPVTVQTVVSALNDQPSQWRDLRDWLISKGVRNWVLHVVVKGGSARRIAEKARGQKRTRTIFPGSTVYPKLWRLVAETQRRGLPIDVRCTDTDTTPNSVVLIGSKGDLYTEGYAHTGKVPLYRVSEARPDRIRALWPHLDHFGHARRYLNWNPWFFGGLSLEKICYRIPLPISLQEHTSVNPVETEAKYRVRNLRRLKALLGELGYSSVTKQGVWQRDEYFDTKEKFSERLDYVVRLRRENGSVAVALKGPRFYAGKEYSRIELEVPAGPANSVAEALRRSGFEVTWFFEKKRKTFRGRDQDVSVAIDEIPEMGYFIEIEGPLVRVREMEKLLSECLGEQETRNYADVFRAFKKEGGIRPEDIKGASFR
jgi:predicted adenylyl cyclase CyaB